MSRKLRIEWQEDADKLKELYKKEKDHQKRTRLQALWLVRTGQPMSEVAPIVGVHYRTVQEWIAWYRIDGVTEVLKHRRGGHGGVKSRLTKGQEKELVTKSKAGEIHSIRDGVDWSTGQASPLQLVKPIISVSGDKYLMKYSLKCISIC